MALTEFRVTGMTCEHCERSVREEVGAVSGVEHVEVNAQTGVLVVTAADAVDDAAIIAAVDEAGYVASRV